MSLRFYCLNLKRNSSCASYRPILIWKGKELPLNITLEYNGNPHFILFTLKENQTEFKVGKKIISYSMRSWDKKNIKYWIDSITIGDLQFTGDISNVKIKTGTEVIEPIAEIFERRNNFEKLNSLYFINRSLIEEPIPFSSKIMLEPNLTSIIFKRPISSKNKSFGEFLIHANKALKTVQSEGKAQDGVKFHSVIGVVICVSTIGVLVAILGFVIYRSRPRKPKYCNTEETEGLIVMNRTFRSKEKLDDQAECDSNSDEPKIIICPKVPGKLPSFYPEIENFPMIDEDVISPLIPSNAKQKQAESDSIISSEGQLEWDNSCLSKPNQIDPNLWWDPYALEQDHQKMDIKDSSDNINKAIPMRDIDEDLSDGFPSQMKLFPVEVEVHCELKSMGSTNSDDSCHYEETASKDVRDQYMLAGKYSSSSSSEESLFEKKGEANFLDDSAKLDKDTLEKINAEFNEHYSDNVQNEDNKQSEIEDANIRFNSYYSDDNAKSINDHQTNGEISKNVNESTSGVPIDNDAMERKRLRFK
ncbi:DgyrCDS10531 [Dimorphilus gyrociliatus]|uniref:DgyrCDS10531 n=1 Tax=Dimorphilus gyrociliatus TaxID=2664684 RepID=A0A7I8W0H2_9ANNE|nr:DgyrCDS10531 [Dimorphilus gyrociliatus]